MPLPCTVLGADRVVKKKKKKKKRQMVSNLTELSGKETKARRGEINGPRSAQQVVEIGRPV